MAEILAEKIACPLEAARHGILDIKHVGYERFELEWVPTQWGAIK